MNLPESMTLPDFLHERTVVMNMYPGRRWVQRVERMSLYKIHDIYLQHEAEKLKET